MRFMMPAFRTNAETFLHDRLGSSRAPSSLSTPATTSRVHTVLLFFVVAAWRLPIFPSASAATGHGKTVIIELANHPSLDDLVQVAGYEGDHLDRV